MSLPFTWDGTLVTGRERELPLVSGDTRIVGVTAAVMTAPTVQSMILRIQDAPSGSESAFIELTIPVGSNTPDAVATGEVLISDGMAPWLKIVQGDGDWLEGQMLTSLGLSVPPGFDLCTLDDVKSMMDPSPTTEDQQIQAIISGVSGRMQDFVGRMLKRTSYVAEVVEVADREFLVTQTPLKAISEVRELGSVVPATDYRFMADGRVIHLARSWQATPGQPIEIDYDGGNDVGDVEYLDVNRLCVKQVLHEYKQERQDRVGESGLALEAGGTLNYLNVDWLPEVRSGLLRIRRFG